MSSKVGVRVQTEEEEEEEQEGYEYKYSALLTLVQGRPRHEVLEAISPQPLEQRLEVALQISELLFTLVLKLGMI